MRLRITFCGPNLELCEKLARHVKDLLYSEAVDIRELPNPLKEVLEVTRRDTFSGHEYDWMNMWSTSFRRMMLEAHREDQVIISSTCGIDQVILQATWLSEQMNIPTTRLLTVDATGTEFNRTDAYINRSGAVLQAILNSAEEEITEQWDFVYAVMPVVASVAEAPDEIIAQYFDFLTTVPAFSKVRRLPDNEDAATDALENEVPSWKAKIAAS